MGAVRRRVMNNGGQSEREQRRQPIRDAAMNNGGQSEREQRRQPIRDAAKASSRFTLLSCFSANARLRLSNSLTSPALHSLRLAVVLVAAHPPGPPAGPMGSSASLVRSRLAFMSPTARYHDDDTDGPREQSQPGDVVMWTDSSRPQSQGVL
ncbi:hypothetical protein Q1695_014198 [Nippostrongylus brasiliensis]|nr:hypothetical protein Q1695_014198 [Nippostrongylus brasiliensis]